MNCEPRIVKTVNLEYDQLLVIETQRGDRVCVIYRGVCLTGSGLARSTICSCGSNSRPWWRQWILDRLARLRILTGKSWKKLEPTQWAPT